MSRKPAPGAGFRGVFRASGLRSRLPEYGIGLAPMLGARLYWHFAELFMTARDDIDPLAPQREAAFFYGLFLRGHDVETLRQDIDVPRTMLEKWMKAHDFEAPFRENLPARLHLQETGAGDLRRPGFQRADAAALRAVGDRRLPAPAGITSLEPLEPERPGPSGARVLRS